jgi:hypothetical protein
MGVSDQRHIPPALYSRGKDPPVRIGQEAGWTSELVWTRARGKILFVCRGSNLDRPVVE